MWGKTITVAKKTKRQGAIKKVFLKKFRKDELSSGAD